MADSDDESSVASEDWHHEFDDYNGEHSRAAEDIYKLIYKSWPKRRDWRGHSWHQMHTARTRTETRDEEETDKTVV